MNFYTDVTQHKGFVFVRGYKDGQRVQYKERLKPYLFVNSRSKDSKYRTLDGTVVDKIEFDSISDAREFTEKYKDVSGFQFYGLTNWIYPFINDTYPNIIEYDERLITTLYIDIEVASDDGFPDVKDARKEVTAITLEFNDKIMVFGCGDYQPKSDNVKYIKCQDESFLLMKFLDVWQSIDPDIVSGWYIEFFDIPYLVNRISRVLGEDQAIKLSPWRILQERNIEINGRDNQVYTTWCCNSRLH